MWQIKYLMIKGDTFFSIGRSLLGAFQTILISILVIHFSSISNWGDFVSIYLIWSFCVLIINGGSKDFVIKSVSQSPAEYWSIISQNTSLRLIISIMSLLVIFLIPFASIQEKGLVMVIIILRVATSSFETLVVYEKKFKQSLTIELSSFVTLMLLIIAGGYYNALQPSFIILFMIVADLLKIISYNTLFSFSTNYQPRSFSIFQNLQSLLPFVGLSIIGLIINKADLYIFGLLVENKAQIGQYHILNSLNNIMLVLASSFLAFRSKALYRAPLRMFKSIQVTYVMHSVFLSALVTLLFYLISPWIFKFSVTPLQLILIVFTTIYFSGTQLYIYLQMRLNKLKNIHFVLSISGAVNILLNIILIPYFKVNGALASVLISNIIAFFILKLMSKKHIT